MPSPSEPLHEVSNVRLKTSYWYVTHKPQLRRVLIGFLIALSIGLYGFSIYRALMMLVVEGPAYRALLQSIPTYYVDHAAFRQIQKPRPVEILAFDATTSNNERYDFIAKVLNPNENFVARKAVFQLVNGSQVVAEKTIIIYPGESRYVAMFGQATSGASPVLRLASVSWLRVHDFINYSSPRLNFEINNISFKPTGESGVHGQLPVSTLDFTVTNKTAYSYWNVGLYMVLIGSGTVSGANYTTLDQFKSGETRQVSMKWYEALPPVAGVEVLPEIDILDPASYMPVE